MRSSAIPEIYAPAVIPWMVHEYNRGDYLVRVPPVRTNTAVAVVPGLFGPTPRDRSFFNRTAQRGGVMEDAMGIMPIPSKMVPQPSTIEFLRTVQYILTLPESLKPPVCEGEKQQGVWDMFFAKINLADSFANGREVVSILAGGQSQWIPIYIREVRLGAENNVKKPKTILKPDKARIIVEMKRRAPEICGRFDDMLLSEGAKTVVGVAHSLGGLAWGEYIFNHHPKVTVVHSVIASAPILPEVLECGIVNPYVSATNLLSIDDKLLDIVLETSIREVDKAVHAHGLINVHVRAVNGYEHGLPIDPVERIVANALSGRLGHVIVG